MRMHESTPYLQIKGIDPRMRMTCCMPGCDEKFIAANGFAFPGTANGGESVEIFFFHSLECYLDGIPIKACVRA